MKFWYSLGGMPMIRLGLGVRSGVIVDGEDLVRHPFTTYLRYACVTIWYVIRLRLV